LAAASEELLQAMADLIPRSLVLRLFLTPHDLASIGITIQNRFILFGRERIQMLDAHHGHLASAILTTGFEQIEIDLAAAEDQAPYLRGRQVVGLVQYLGEAAASQILE